MTMKRIQATLDSYVEEEHDGSVKVVLRMYLLSRSEKNLIEHAVANGDAVQLLVEDCEDERCGKCGVCLDWEADEGSA